MAKSSTSKGAKKSRVKVKDLKAGETKLTAKQMKKVRGGDAGGANQETGQSSTKQDATTSASNAVASETQKQSSMYNMAKSIISKI